jgi:nucleoid DNA-binding protein
MQKTITKPELVTGIINQTGVSKLTIITVLSALESAAKNALQAGNAVTIPGLVKLTPKDRAARIGRNPATGESLSIPAKRVVIAKPATTILD